MVGHLSLYILIFSGPLHVFSANLGFLTIRWLQLSGPSALTVQGSEVRGLVNQAEFTLPFMT